MMRRILVLAHREELIYQAVGHAKTAGLTAGIEMGNLSCGGEQVVVATVQTLVSRRKCRQCKGGGCPDCGDKGFAYRCEKFNPWDFEAVIVDEGHHATAATYRRVIQHFRQNESLKVLLVTATPQRSDGVGLWNVVDTCAYQMELRAAIDNGWLCPIRQRFIQVDSLDLSDVPTKMGGDLADGELERVFLGGNDHEKQKLLHEIAKPSIEQSKGKPLLIFASGVRHAMELTAACNAYDGISAECVIGETDKTERKKIIERYKAGETNVLVGCGVFTEGFDAPATEVIAMARPTKSLTLYLQCIGRGTRPLPGVVDGLPTSAERLAAIENSGKPSCIVLDFVGNSGRHRLVSVADALAGESVSSQDLDEAIAAAKGSQEPEDMEALIEKAKQAREERERVAEEARRSRISTKKRAEQCQYDAVDVDIFNGQAYDPVSDYVPQAGGASVRQVNYLIGLGVKAAEAMKMSKSRAGAVITAMKSRTGGEYRITAGKHRGKKLSQLPTGYQDWILKTDAFGAADHVREMRGYKRATA